MNTKGAAGPLCFDSHDWKSVLVSGQFGTSSNDLCEAIASMAKALCTEDRTLNGAMSALMACLLIPLDKDPRLMPIGIGEVLRRIIGKMVDVCEAVALDVNLCTNQLLMLTLKW